MRVSDSGRRTVMAVASLCFRRTANLSCLPISAALPALSDKNSNHERHDTTLYFVDYRTPHHPPLPLTTGGARRHGAHRRPPLLQDAGGAGRREVAGQRPARHGARPGAVCRCLPLAAGLAPCMYRRVWVYTLQEIRRGGSKVSVGGVAKRGGRHGRNAGFIGPPEVTSRSLVAPELTIPLAHCSVALLPTPLARPNTRRWSAGVQEEARRGHVEELREHPVADELHPHPGQGGPHVRLRPLGRDHPRGDLPSGHVPVQDHDVDAFGFWTDRFLRG